MKKIEIESIDVNEFKSILKEEIKAELKEQLKGLNTKQTEEKYLSRLQVKEMLGVSLVTLSNWSKSGILCPYGIGNRIYYKLSDIEKSLIKING